MAYFAIVLRMVFLSEVIRERYVAAEVSFRLRCMAFGIGHIFVDNLFYLRILFHWDQGTS
jgi:hypothetical protein